VFGQLKTAGWIRGQQRRMLAVGLIAVQAQLPAMSMFVDDDHDCARLREMTLAAIEPILGLYNAIHKHHGEHGWGGGGGCGGGGCGGGS
jgi:hypothetical protein